MYQLKWYKPCCLAPSGSAKQLLSPKLSLKLSAPYISDPLLGSFPSPSSSSLSAFLSASTATPIRNFHYSDFLHSFKLHRYYPSLRLPTIVLVHSTPSPQHYGSQLLHHPVYWRPQKCFCRATSQQRCETLSHSSRRSIRLANGPLQRRVKYRNVNVNLIGQPRNYAGWFDETTNTANTPRWNDRNK